MHYSLKFNLFFLFLFFNLSLWCQKTEKTVFTDSLSLKGASRFIGRDAFDNYYYIKNNALVKKGNQGIKEYKNVALGSIETVDILNPLQIVLFYKDFNSVVLLDNQLNQTISINGNELNDLITFENIGLASQNRFWFYDSISQKIGLYQFKTNQYKLISTPINNKIVFFQSDYNYAFWVDENQSVYGINLFGKIFNLGKLPPYEMLQFINEKQCVFFENDHFSIYNFENKEITPIPTDQKSLINFFYKEGILSIFTPWKSILNYKIN